MSQRDTSATKLARSRRTTRQKLLASVAEAREALLGLARVRSAEVERAMYPSAAGRVVRLLLARAAISRGTSSRGSRLEGRSRLRRVVLGVGRVRRPEAECSNFGAPAIRCAAHMTPDPEKPLEEELERVEQEAKLEAVPKC